MKYVFFLGCVIPQKENAYELSARRVAEKLGIQLIDLVGANCCGFSLNSVNYLGATLLAARNLSLTEEKGYDLVTLCPACFGHLNKVRMELIRDHKLRKIVNQILREINRKIEDPPKAKHFAQVLLEDVGFKKIKDTVAKPLNRLRVAPHYGCHILKPSDEIRFDNPEDPELLDSLIKVTGAECVEYVEKGLCCGAPVWDEELSLRIAREKLKSVQRVGADAIITVCPFCHNQFDLNQLTMEEEYSETYQIPVLHYTQLLGLAQGFTPDELGLSENRVPIDTILSAL